MTDPLLEVRDLCNRARDAGLSCLEVARRIGVRPSTVHRWKGGDSAIPLRRFYQIQQLVLEAEARAEEAS